MNKRWETATKFYEINLRQDAFGYWLVYRDWGSRFNRRGNHKVSVLQSREAAYKLIGKIGNIRRCHGYYEVSCLSTKIFKMAQMSPTFQAPQAS